jgi:hypothetical protein
VPPEKGLVIRVRYRQTGKERFDEQTKERTVRFTPAVYDEDFVKRLRDAAAFWTNSVIPDCGFVYTEF